MRGRWLQLCVAGAAVFVASICVSSASEGSGARADANARADWNATLSASSLRWTVVRAFDHARPARSGLPLNAVACASDSYCVTFGSQLFTSTAPATAAWTAGTTVSEQFPVTALVCPAATLCVGWNRGDSTDRHIYTTTAPGTSAWRASSVPFQSQLVALACPASSLCVALDSTGEVFASTDPAAGTWTPAPSLPSSFQPSALSCPSTTLCVVAGTQPTGTGASYRAQGAVAASSNPAAGGWQEHVVDPSGDGLAALSCPAANLCVGLDRRNAPLISTNPASEAWSVGHPIDGAGAGSMNGLACSAEGACISNEGSGILWASAAPSRAWTRVQLTRRGRFDEINDFTCARTLCVAVDQTGNVFTSSRPATHWTRHLVAAVNPILAVSCSTAQLCAAVDATGHAFTSVSPSGGATAWSIATIDPGRALTAVACAARSLCVAGDRAGTLFARTSAWKRAMPGSGHAIVSLACPSAALCLAVDARGAILRSLHPAVAGSWSRIAGAGHAGEISCPTIDFCAIAAFQTVLTSTGPGRPASIWQAHRPRHGYDLFSISCADPHHCVALGEPGCCLVDALATSDPTGPAAWADASIADYAHQGDIAAEVSCGSTALCVDADNFGNVSVSTDPFGRPRWRQQRLEPQDSGFALDDVSCTSARLCLGVDDHGGLFVGSS